jgi:hypothetical protein
VKIIQTISVPAGSFESLKINGDIDYTYTKRGSDDSARFNASIWYSVENGFLIRTSGTMSMTLNEYNLTAEASIDNELYAYEVGINSIGKAFSKQQTSFYPSVTSAIIKRLDNNQLNFIRYLKKEGMKDV